MEENTRFEKENITGKEIDELYPGLISIFEELKRVNKYCQEQIKEGYTTKEELSVEKISTVKGKKYLEETLKVFEFYFENTRKEIKDTLDVIKKFEHGYELIK